MCLLFYHFHQETEGLKVASFGRKFELMPLEKRDDDFKKIGRLGCSGCYDAFRKYLIPLLKRIHGSNKHYGKMPLSQAKPVELKSEIEELKTKLQKAIQKEEFEEAANLRDTIKDLENKEENKDKGTGNEPRSS